MHGPLKAPRKVNFLRIWGDFSGPYGPIWARPGPLKSRKNLEKTYIFLWKHRGLQVSGRNMLENAYKITSKSKFSTQNVQISYHLHPALSYSLEVGSSCISMVHSHCDKAATVCLQKASALYTCVRGSNKAHRGYVLGLAKIDHMMVLLLAQPLMGRK